jgi:hypothetical protein
MTKNLTTKSTKSSSTFKFYRMTDGSMIAGQYEKEQEEFVILSNAVMLGCIETDHIEQKYYFKGMQCPFSLESPIFTKLQKTTIVSVNTDLDSHFENQYNKYVSNWFSMRDKKNLVEEEVDKKELEKKILLLTKALANTVVH